MFTTGADELISRFGSAEKAALRLLIDLPGPTLTPQIESFFASLPWTGVILFQKNIVDQAGLSLLIRNLQAIGQTTLPEAPLLVAVDEEGGSVSPLEGLLTPSPGNMALAASGDLEGTYRLSRHMARELRELGFNVNFAPVLDVNSNPRNPIIGIRSFGEAPARVAEFGAKTIQAFQEEGILATAKHFPGHGDTSKDSHLELPVVDRSRDTLEKIDFLPFTRAISAHVWGMMTAHVIYPGLDSKPATLSHTILTDLLRKKMGFEGIIFTDAFDMAAIKEHFDLEKAVIDSLKAGADVLLSLGDSKIQLQTHEVIKKAIEKGILTEDEIVPSLQRILAFRKRLGAFKPSAPVSLEEHEVESLHAKSVTLVSGRSRLPLASGVKILLSPEATRHLPLFQKYFSGMTFFTWPWPDAPSRGTADTLLFFAERRLLSPDVEAVLPLWAPHLAAAVSFGNPYFLSKISEVPVRITTYHFNEIFVREVHRVLLENGKAPGKLPVTL